MNKMQAKKRAMVAASTVLYATARSSEIFENGDLSDADVEKCRAALHRIAGTMLGKANRIRGVARPRKSGS